MTQLEASHDLVSCPMCGDENPAEANFCQSCGHDLRLAALTSGDVPADQTLAADETLIARSEGEAVEPTRAGADHQLAFRTDPGRKPGANQDAGGAWSWVRTDGVPVSLMVVADGVSAGRKSEEASRLVVDVLADRLGPVMQDPANDVVSLHAALLEAAQEANRKVAERPHHTIATADTTTLVAAFCLGDRGAGVWCGDSRVYHLARGRMVQLTRDHNWAEAVISHGLMSAEQAANDPRSRMITRWIGPSDREDPGFESFDFELAPGDAVLCCTDGLYMYFSAPVADEEEMARVIRTYPQDLQKAADSMVDMALERGGHDNITVAIIALPQNDEERTPTVRMPSLTSSDETQTLRLDREDDVTDE